MNEGTRNYGHASHKIVEERPMIDNHLHCETCPTDDGIKGKWKNISEFYSAPQRSRGVTKRCKDCVKSKRYGFKPKGTRVKRKPVPDEDALSSLSRLMARAAWTKGLDFKGITA